MARFARHDSVAAQRRARRLASPPQDKGLSVTLDPVAAAGGDTEALVAVASAVFSLCIQCDDRDSYLRDICEMSDAHQTELMEAFGPFNVDGDAESEADASDVEDTHDAADADADTVADQPDAAASAAAVETGAEVPATTMDQTAGAGDASPYAHADGYESDDAGARAGMAALQAELSRLRSHLEIAEARATAAEAAREREAATLQKLERAQRAEDAETAAQLESAAVAAAQLAARDAELSEAREQLKRLAAEATQ